MRNPEHLWAMWELAEPPDDSDVMHMIFILHALMIIFKLLKNMMYIEHPCYSLHNGMPCAQLFDELWKAALIEDRSG